MTTPADKRRPLTSEELAVTARLRRLWDDRKDKRGVTQDAVAAALGVSQGAVSHYLTGRNAINAKAAVAFGRLLGVDPRDFAGDMPGLELLAEGWEPASQGPSSQAETFAEIPMWSARVGAAVSEPEAESELVGSLLFRPASLKRKRINASAAHVFYVSGDSMAPTIKDGAVVLFDTSDRTLRSGKLYVIAWSGERLVKRLFNEGGVVKVVSDNPSPAYPERVVQPDDDTFEIIGRVRWTASWED